MTHFIKDKHPPPLYFSKNWQGKGRYKYQWSLGFIGI